ncbi:hypothetical protein L798_07750 [Zootermopsis nevadensis]|uniref:Uncharacterized protein n=1 Tax=Zootermopsis nevadensis TaxID=136037 RepID=A0A067R534_ZOONE|nr:hypothetical protein L798_07750 [Zootermopsis nevadensis]
MSPPNSDIKLFKKLRKVKENVIKYLKRDQQFEVPTPTRLGGHQKQDLMQRGRELCPTGSRSTMTARKGVFRISIRRQPTRCDSATCGLSWG